MAHKNTVLSKIQNISLFMTVLSSNQSTNGITHSWY